MSTLAPVAAPAARAAATAGHWLAPLADQWIGAARALLEREPVLVRVTVIALRGSAPREAGATMLLHRRGTVGSIGGGALEWQASLAARELLATPEAAPVRLVDLVLGPDLGQCCGGRVELWLERLTRADLPWLLEAQASVRPIHAEAGAADALPYDLVTEFSGDDASHRLQPSTAGRGALVNGKLAGGTLMLREPLCAQRPPLWIFGAGHVGQALVRLLSELALFEITWIDSRPELLPPDLDGAIRAKACANPVDFSGAAPAGARFVVLTHDHALDYQLCRSILRRGDASWLGLIGSASKAARFRSRLRRDGLGEDRVAALKCPIGARIGSKLPAAIAISIAAELLQVSSASPPLRPFEQLPACRAGDSCDSCGSNGNSTGGRPANS